MAYKAAMAEAPVRFRSSFEPDRSYCASVFQGLSTEGPMGGGGTIDVCSLNRCGRVLSEISRQSNPKGSPIICRSRGMDRKQGFKVAVFIRANLSGLEFKPELLANGPDAMALII